MSLTWALSLALMVGIVCSNNVTITEDVCAPVEGPWSSLLEEWAISAPVQSDRHGRIMALPAANGYYVTERIDGPLMPPPPPPGHGPGGHGRPHHMHHGGPPPPPPHHMPPPGQHGFQGPQSYNEWEGTPPPSGGKIVNRPSNTDKFKPSYPPPSPGSRPPQRLNTIDRVDDPPRKQVSETDLYLLGAIEKLVYRVDLMEKRLRKMEENMHILVAGTEAKPEPCPGNSSRVGSGCYEWSREAADWQAASRACRRRRPPAALLELAGPAQRRALHSTLLADKKLKGSDFWTGGLNPGLLWIWSHSAKPVETNNSSNATSSIVGEGRCLALVHDPAINDYVFRGQDCALRHRYICQLEEDKSKLSNEIERAARKLLDNTRKPKLLQVDDES